MKLSLLLLCALGVLCGSISAQPKFTVNCPHCQLTFTGQTPLNIVTNGGRSVPGGIMIERTMEFTCPVQACRETIRAKNEKFLPESIAIEETNAPAAQVPPGEALTPLALKIKARDGTNFIGQYMGMIAEWDGWTNEFNFQGTRKPGPPFQGVMMYSATSGELLKWISYEDFRDIFVLKVKPEYPRAATQAKGAPLPPLPIHVDQTNRMKSLSLSSMVAPAVWSERPFSYTAVAGQEPQLDPVMLQQTGWQIWLQFLQQSNCCYRICASSNQAPWAPLTAVCPQPEESTQTVKVPVTNFPLEWNAQDAGQWSPLTNLVTTAADNISYKLEANRYP